MPTLITPDMLRGAAELHERVRLLAPDNAVLTAYTSQVLLQMAAEMKDDHRAAYEVQRLSTSYQQRTR